MFYGLGVLVMVLILLISVGLHECGHLIPAKRFGVKVPQFAIGFGPTLWSKVKAGTEWCIKAIPLGGYVRILGMYPPARPGVKTHRANGQLTLAEEARQASFEELGEGDQDKAFYLLTPGKRMIVMLGGPVMNLFLAIIFFSVAILGFGTPVRTAELSFVQQCLAGPGVMSCPDEEQAPAARAGLRAGDTVIAWNDQQLGSWEDFTAAIAANGTREAQITYLRDGHSETTTLTPVEIERSEDDGSSAQVAYVGVSGSLGRERGSIDQVPPLLWQVTTGTGKALISLPVQVWNLTVDLVTGKERSDSSVMGIVGAGRIAGEMTSAEVAGYDLGDRAADLLSLAGSLNLSLFLLNLFPLVPLDGGHILGALVEASRRGWARLRGKPQPPHLDTARTVGLSYVMWGVLLLMGIILILGDIFRPLTLGG